ncbi:Fumarate reductase flavoprotein subunit [hydrothermal vent metagenome]|uniref:Fumarate reductase flavoprotein subunit n=1 Tax=hydrothermal vent metagenome TaxID=652676 RepID=A0A3B0W5J3_9ZZZZ
MNPLTTQLDNNFQQICLKVVGEGTNDKTGGEGTNDKTGGEGTNDKTGGEGTNDKVYCQVVPKS